MIFNRHRIKKLLESCGGKATVAAKQIKSRLALKEDDPKHIDVDNFSLRETAEGCGIDTSQPEILAESVSVTQFTTIMSELISKKIMDSYEENKGIADQLVTPFNSSLETDKIPGVYIKGDMEDILPGADYPHLADMAEKYITIDHAKRGLILDITDEAVRFDQTGLIMKRAADIGKIMARDREKRVLYAIQDQSGYYPYYPSGTRQAMYETAGGSGDPHEYSNLTTDALTDYTDISALYTLLKLMQGDDGEYLQVIPKILLVPVTLEVMAKRIIENNVLMGAANAERNPFANMFKIFSSPWLDAVSSVSWYLGDFKAQFLEKIVIPMEVSTRKYGDKNEDAWNRDIVASYKARYDTKVGAIDYRFVGKSTGAN